MTTTRIMEEKMENAAPILFPRARRVPPLPDSITHLKMLNKIFAPNTA